MPDPITPAKSTRAKPRTLRTRINDLGAYHLEAFDRARKTGGESYEKSIRDALDNADAACDAVERRDRAHIAAVEAQAAYDAAHEIAVKSQPTLDDLTKRAKALHALDHPD